MQNREKIYVKFKAVLLKLTVNDQSEFYGKFVVKRCIADVHSPAKPPQGDIIHVLQTQFSSFVIQKNPEILDISY